MKKKFKDKEKEVEKISIPKKYGNLILKEKEGLIDVLSGKTLLGVISMPSKVGQFYINSWGVFKNDKLAECYTNFEEAIGYFAKKKEKKNRDFIKRRVKSAPSGDEKRKKQR